MKSLHNIDAYNFDAHLCETAWQTQNMTSVSWTALWNTADLEKKMWENNIWASAPLIGKTTTTYSNILGHTLSLHINYIWEFSYTPEILTLTL